MTNQIKPTLSKGRILERKKISEYLVEYLAKDVFNNKEIIITITAKEQMLSTYEKGDIVYFAESKLSPQKGKLMVPSTLKRNPYLLSLKPDVDRRYSELKAN